MRLHWVPFLTILVACQTTNPTAQSSVSNEPQPVPSVLDTPVEFAGPESSRANPAALGEIRIGLFAPTSPEHLVGRSMFDGAKLAIEQFNASGSFNGVPLRLKRRWDDDPWRGGSKEMIKLVYEDSVLAVIGSVDGATTHVAEQVVTKAWLPLLSPVSADPTLTYIRIPWMFRLPPNDEVQAAVLIRDGIAANLFSNVGLITSTDHDGRIFGEEIREKMSEVGVPPAFHLQVSLSDIDFKATAERVVSFGSEAVVARLPVREMVGLLDSFEAAGLDVPVLIPWVPGLQPAELGGRYSGRIYYVFPFSDVENQQYAAFRRVYLERYGYAPTPSAAYTYDAVNLLIQSLRLVSKDGPSGLNRTGLRDALADLNGHVGVTGPFLWDNAGGNQTEPVLRVLEGRGSSN